MDTPLYNFLKEYSSRQPVRMHMPGHKGRAAVPELDPLYSIDITEIEGADSLFEANGIIKASEQNASALFGTAETCYSTGGSTLCIQTMLGLMKLEGRRVAAVRNVHRAFISACALLDISPEWIYPRYENGILSGKIPLDEVQRRLSRGNACLYVTSPDYLGRQADIAKLSELCRKNGAYLIVDNAHGAHTLFTGGHPIALGADMCCDSAHKTLPALTGAAYLHIGNPRFCGRVKSVMSLFGSTSPSYPVMASLDLCNRYIAEKMNGDTKRILAETKRLRSRISGRYRVYDSEPFHLTLLCRGTALAAKLRDCNIECEYADESCIVLLLSPTVTKDELLLLESSLMETAPLPPLHNGDFSFPVMEQAVSLREGALSPSEEIPVEKAAGRICGMLNVPCPPAVPIAVCGERINEECVKIYKRYGILNVNVLK